MSGQIDRRYSEPKAEALSWQDIQARLAGSEVAWVVTVRPDGRPHATPMVPVVDKGKVYFHTGSNEVKFANIEANPHVLILAGDTEWTGGLDVAIQGTAVPVTGDAALQRISELYRERWDGRWQLDVQDGALASPAPGTQLVVFEIAPEAAHGFAKGNPFSQTTYRRADGSATQESVS